MHELTIPLEENAVRSLDVGDVVSLSGILVTARDAAHKYMVETFVDGEPGGEAAFGAILESRLRGGAIYHCGPVVAKEGDRWRFVAAGPTTSMREEPYEGKIIRRFGVRAVIGKGGMGPTTLAACRESGCVYLHTVGGAATFLADAVKEVVEVHKLDTLGAPEAFWVIRVEGFPAVVTMDAKGQSLHASMREASEKALATALGL